MKKEEIAAVAQLLTAMKDAIAKLREAQRKKDSEQINLLKREILGFQKNIDQNI